MALPSNFLTNLLHSAETPNEKYELLKQFGYLSDYGLENREHFVEIVAHPEKYIDETNNFGYGYNPNLLSFKLAAEGFLNIELQSILGGIPEFDTLSEAEREYRIQLHNELFQRHTHIVELYLRGKSANEAQVKSEHQSSATSFCAVCRQAILAGSRFCIYCGASVGSFHAQAKVDSVDAQMFIQCPKCNARNGKNTPLCEQCDAKLPCEFGTDPRCSMCGTENNSLAFQCSRCQHFLKPSFRCPTCGKHDRTPQPFDIHGCSHGIRVHWSSPPKS